MLPDAAERLAQLVEAAPFGLSIDRWIEAEGLPEGTRHTLPPDALVADDGSQGGWILAGTHRAAVRDALLRELAAFHEREPDSLGPDAGRLRRLAAPRLPEPLWHALLASLLADGAIARRGSFVHLPAHGLRLSASDERLAQKILPPLSAAGFEGVWVRDLARNANESEALVRVTVARLAQRGELHQVVKDLFYAPATIVRLAAIVRSVAAESGGEVTAGRFRDATGIGRKRAIHLLEYFDRIGLMRRIGDAHRLRADTRLFTESER
jgi:selenocysteine-specific elongation factor